MPEFLLRHRLFLTAVALFVVSLQLMHASIRDRSLPNFGARVVATALGPLSEATNHLGTSGASLWDNYLWLIDAAKERDELKARVGALEGRNSRLVEFEVENQRLRKLLKFSRQKKFEMIAADVIAHDPSNWNRTIAINRGLAEGVREGSAVLDGRAVVGQVISAGWGSSRVLLLTDQRSAIDVLVQSTRARGVVEGMRGAGLRLSYVEKEYAVRTGDRIVTSGLDQVFPKGVLVGVVTRIEEVPNSLFHRVSMEPSADLERLETVLVTVPTELEQAKSAPPERAEAGQAEEAQ